MNSFTIPQQRKDTKGNAKRSKKVEGMTKKVKVTPSLEKKKRMMSIDLKREIIKKSTKRVWV